MFKRHSYLILIFIIVISLLLTGCGNGSQTSTGELESHLAMNVTFDDHQFVIIPDAFDVYNEETIERIINIIKDYKFTKELCDCDPIATLTLNNGDVYYVKGSIDFSELHAITKDVNGETLQAPITKELSDILLNLFPNSNSDNGASLRKLFSATILKNERVSGAFAISVRTVESYDTYKLYRILKDEIYTEKNMCGCDYSATIQFEDGSIYYLIEHDGKIDSARNTTSSTWQSYYNENLNGLFESLIKDSYLIDISVDEGTYINEKSGSSFVIDETTATYIDAKSQDVFSGKYETDFNILKVFVDEDHVLLFEITDSSFFFIKEYSAPVSEFVEENLASFKIKES